MVQLLWREMGAGAADDPRRRFAICEIWRVLLGDTPPRCFWEVDAAMTVVEDRDGSAMLVSGCRGTGEQTPSAAEKVRYLRQPDPVGGQPHYVQQAHSASAALGGGKRRHLFFNTETRKWQISPVCNDSEGAFAVSETGAADGRWCVPHDGSGPITYSHVRPSY